MPQFIISSSSIKHGMVVINGKDYKHVKSLRISPDEQLILLDENANQYIATLVKIEGHQAIFRIIDHIQKKQKQSGIILAQSIIKYERMRIAIEKATELGVYGIIPFISRYTVAKGNYEYLINKYSKVIKEAVSQSMHQHIPKLYPVITYKELIVFMPDVKKVLFHYGKDVLPLQNLVDTLGKDKYIMLIIGPEGGFSNEEIEYAKLNNISIAGLGDNILRAETAAISAVSIVSFLRKQK
jgi:16S rRNA (uracil1498-N3)-methyltransferase